ncbi:hypothetical protein Hanom_Chr14g01274741 [Helianthus anomalus]
MIILTRKFGQSKANEKMDPVITLWRFDEDTDMVTVICDNRAQEDYKLEDIMTKQGVGFMEELHNAACLTQT